jgi:hypothetical protein
LSEVPFHYKNNHILAAIRSHEIRRCKKHSVGYSHVQLVGDRYGPNVLPSIIPSVAFESIMEVMEDNHHMEQIVLLSKWYHLDENHIPECYVLQPINSLIPGYLSSDKAVHEAAEEQWLEQVELLEESLCIASEGHMDDSWREIYQTSELHSEFVQGVTAFKSKDGIADKCVAYVREFDEVVYDDDVVMNYVDVRSESYVNANGGREHIRYIDDPVKKERLDALKVALENSGINVTKYSVPSIKSLIGGESSDYLQSFLDKFRSDMIHCLMKTSKLTTILPTPLEADVATHVNVARVRQSHFIQNAITDKAVKECIKYLEDDSDVTCGPYYVHGPSGSGKTYILSKVLQHVNDNAFSFIRFVGTGHSTSSGYELLSSLCEQMMYVLANDDGGGSGEEENEMEGKRKVESELPHTFTDMCLKFAKTLKILADRSPDSQVIIILDGLDDLVVTPGNDTTMTFSWLPTILPRRTKIIVSGDTEKETTHNVLNGICPSGLKVDRWSAECVEKYILTKLESRGRVITKEQMGHVTKSLGEHSSPLVAQMVLHEVATWSSYMEKDHFTPIRPQAAWLVDRMLDKLERKHGEVIIRAVYGYIDCAVEGGLSTNEILDVCSLDDQLLKMMEVLLPDGYSRVSRRFPTVMLTRILQESVDILEQRVTADGSLVWAFAHKMISASVRRRCEKMSPHLHRGLAEYFSGMHADGKQFCGTGDVINRSVDPQSLLGFGGKPNIRRIMELPYHFVKCKEWDGLRDFLSNLNVLDVLGHRGSRRSYLRPGTARSMLLELWRVYEEGRGRAGMMAEVYRNALEEWQKDVSPSVRDSSRRMKSVAVFLKDAGLELNNKKYVKAAAEMFEQLLRREELEFGADHPATVSTYRMLQNCLSTLGMDKKLVFLRKGSVGMNSMHGGLDLNELREEEKKKLQQKPEAVKPHLMETPVKGRPARLGSWKVDDMDVPEEMLESSVSDELTPVALREKIEKDSPTPISPIPIQQIHSPLRETVNKAREQARANTTPHTGLDSWIATKGEGFAGGIGRGENLNYFEGDSSLIEDSAETIDLQ